MATISPPVRRSRWLDPHASPLLRIDWLMWFAAGATTGLGLVMIHSATRNRARLTGRAIDPLYFVQRQGIAVVIGVVLAVIATAIDYRRLRDLWPLFYGLSLPLLLAVRFVGAGQGGTTAWFNVGPFQFQPSEVAKLVLIVALAGYCHRHQGELDAWHLAQALGLAAVPMGLVMLQNDLGTMLVMGVCVIAVLVVAGLKPVHLLVLFMVAASVLGGLLLSGKFTSYRLDRLTSFLDQNSDAPVQDLSSSEFNLRQAKAAIAAGGLTGQGLRNGTLTQAERVPEQRTDFIFTAVGEELGFVGGAVLLGLYALLVWRMWRTAGMVDDLFGSMVCIGFVAMFTFQVFENVGMTMGMMPITGIPLPFLSYGGSAMISYWVAVGIAQSIHRTRHEM